eukprot:gene8904-10549_t
MCHTGLTSTVIKESGLEKCSNPDEEYCNACGAVGAPSCCDEDACFAVQPYSGARMCHTGLTSTVIKESGLEKCSNPDEEYCNACGAVGAPSCCDEDACFAVQPYSGANLTAACARMCHTGLDATII